LAQMPGRRPPTGIRTTDVKVPKGAYEGRTYKRVMLPPLCRMSSSKQNSNKPTASWVFYSPFNCDQRLKMLHVGFHADAKHLLEIERHEAQVSSRRKADAHRDHVLAVKESLSRLPRLAEHVLAHFRLHIRDSYRAVAAKHALTVLGRYLVGHRLFREAEQMSAARTDATVEASETSTVILSLLRGQVDSSTGALQQGSNGRDMRLLLARFERARLKEAHAKTGSSSWPGLSDTEANVVDAFDTRLLDLAALRGYVDRLHRSGSASSSIAGVLAILIKAIEWRRSFHQSICNGLITSSGGLQTVNGFAMTRFDEAIQMLRQLSRHHRRNGATIDDNRNIPRRPPRDIVADMSVYEDLCAALEKDIIAFEATAKSWTSGRLINERAFGDLQAAVVSFIDCGFVPARPLPLSNITLGQWRAAKRSAQMRYEALKIGALRDGPGLDDNTLLKPMCSLEKASAQRNGRHQFFITQRLLRVMKVFEIARSCIAGAQEDSSALFIRFDGRMISSTQMSSLVKKTSLWYTGHALTFVMLRKAHASALAGSGVARLERSVGELEEEVMTGRNEANNSRASGGREDVHSASLPLEQTMPMPPVSHGQHVSSANEARRASPASRDTTSNMYAVRAREQLSRTAFTENKDMTPGQTATGAAAVLGGVDIGHGQRSQNRYYLTPGLSTRHSFAARRLAVASGVAERPNISHTSSIDTNGSDVVMTATDLARFNAMEYATRVRTHLSRHTASDYINPCAEP